MGPTVVTAVDGTRHATSLRQSDVDDDEYLWSAFEELDHRALESVHADNSDGHNINSTSLPPVPNDICATKPGPVAPSAAISPPGSEAVNRSRSGAQLALDPFRDTEPRSVAGSGRSDGSHTSELVISTSFISAGVPPSNQHQLHNNQESQASQPPAKRGPGRPKGSGPKQKALAANPEAAPVVKRRPGRPCKVPPPVDASHFIHTMHLPGNSSASTSSLAPIFGRNEPNFPSPSIATDSAPVLASTPYDPVRPVCPEPSTTNPVDSSASAEDILRDGSGCGIGEDNYDLGDGEEESEEPDGEIPGSGRQSRHTR